MEIKLSPSGDKMYSSDSFWLNAEVLEAMVFSHSMRILVPICFLHTRAEKGTDTFLELHWPCVTSPQVASPGRAFQFQIPTRSWAALMPVDLIRVEVLALAVLARASRVEMFISFECVNFECTCYSGYAKIWGPEAKGLAVSLVLDRDNYVLGEDIPLRLALENFSANGTVTSGELPCFAGLTIDVRDSSGQAIHPRDNSEVQYICTGHGWTQKYPLAEVVPVLGSTLRGYSQLPERPGNYTVTASWDAHWTAQMVETPF